MFRTFFAWLTKCFGEQVVGYVAIGLITAFVGVIVNWWWVLTIVSVALAVVSLWGFRILRREPWNWGSWYLKRAELSDIAEVLEAHSNRLRVKLEGLTETHQSSSALEVLDTLLWQFRYKCKAWADLIRALDHTQFEATRLRAIDFLGENSHEFRLFFQGQPEDTLRAISQDMTSSHMIRNRAQLWLSRIVSDPKPADSRAAIRSFNLEAD